MTEVEAYSVEKRDADDYPWVVRMPNGHDYRFYRELSAARFDCSALNDAFNAGRKYAEDAGGVVVDGIQAELRVARERQSTSDSPSAYRRMTPTTSGTNP